MVAGTVRRRGSVGHHSVAAAESEPRRDLCPGLLVAAGALHSTFEDQWIKGQGLHHSECSRQSGIHGPFGQEFGNEPWQRRHEALKR